MMVEVQKGAWRTMTSKGGQTIEKFQWKEEGSSGASYYVQYG